MLVYTGDTRDDTNLDNAFIGELTYGRELGSNFALEVTAGYLHDAHEGDELDGYAGTLTLLRSFPIKTMAVLVGVGGGVYAMEFTGRIGNAQVDDEDTVAGGHLVLGGRFPAGQFTFVGLEGKYRFFEEAVFDSQILETDGFSAMLNVGHRF